ncbi:alpha/beta hydrolase [Janthinobacterium sp.]|uniref:alpha/beta hydrolase n=1 Tax=Janthinobacterium sp. TaxID=1871054 RepID=UPI002DBB2D6E|nr:alpha/beta fold hydrolase [Janthinobacterium sp.]HEU4815898.1 alpha/beta fold hydrolase [Janthinobacterium sp.]
MRIVIGMAVAAIGLYAFACLGLYLAQRSLIFFPQPRRFGSDASVVKMQLNGVQLMVSNRPHSGPKAVLYFGGNAEDVSGSLPALAAAFPDQAVYLLHYRGYGGSAGKPTQADLFADALALFDKLHAEHAEITVIGRSLGSGVATHVASQRPAARLVLVTPYDSIAGIAAVQFPIFPVQFLLTDKFETWRDAPQVTVPTTLVAAQNDEMIPRASSQQLLGRFKPGVARYVEIPDTGHNTISDSPAYPRALVQ